jgi:hypothetical protein
MKATRIIAVPLAWGGLVVAGLPMAVKRFVCQVQRLGASQMFPGQ